MHSGGMSSIDVSIIRTKGCHFELKTVLQHDDYAKMRADGVRAREKRLDGFGSRAGSDVVVLRRYAANDVADTTTSEVRDVPLATQSLDDLPRRFFHRRSFHCNHCSRFAVRSATRASFSAEGVAQFQPETTAQEQICGDLGAKHRSLSAEFRFTNFSAYKRSG